jgi:hypothetical protein
VQGIIIDLLNKVLSCSIYVAGDCVVNRTGDGAIPRVTGVGMGPQSTSLDFVTFGTRLDVRTADKPL